MNFNDEQNNASDKHADDPVQSGQSEQNTIRILKPGSNNDLIDQLRGGPLDKTSVNYEYHSPDPTETAQRLALINYLCAGEEKMVPFNPVNLLQIMSSHKMETDDVALIAGTDSVAVESWFQDGVASETALHNIACAVGVSTEWIRGFVSGKDETLKEVAIKWSAAPDMTPQTVLYRRPVAQFSNFQPKIVSSWLILALFQANFLISGRSRLCPYQLVNSNQVRQGE